MKISFPMKVTASDSQKRLISGRIVTWNEEGSTSAGRTIFLPNSISFGQNVKLLWEHQLTKPLGKLQEASVTEDGIDATFKIANTMSGEDALVEAAEGLRDGFSVGVSVDAWSNVEGVMTISAATLIETSLVTTPAIDSARVAEVAASEEEKQDSSPESPVEVEEGKDEVSETVSEAASTETVEAAKSEVTASAAFYTRPRLDLNVTAGQVAKAQVSAMFGDRDARDLIAALDEQNTTTDFGVVPPTYLRDLIGIVDGSRPFWDSLEQGTLPASGMKFYKPRRKVLATTAVTAEEAEFDSTETEIDNIEIDVVKIAGANIVSVELIDRSSPAYVDELLRQLAADWARKSDVYAASIVLGAPQDSTGASLYKGIAKGIADAYGVMRFTPNRFLADVGNYADLLGEVDDVERPLFAAAAPQNAAGLITQCSTAGTVAGLALVVDPNFDTGTGVEGYVYPSAAGTVYGGAGIQLRSNIVATGQVEIGLYGYVAASANYPDAVRAIKVS